MQIKTGQMKRLEEKSVGWHCDSSLWSPGAATSVSIRESNSSQLSRAPASGSLHARIMDSLYGLGELGWISSPFLSPEPRLALSQKFFSWFIWLSLVYTQAKGSQITKISTTWVMKGLWKVCARNPVQKTKQRLYYSMASRESGPDLVMLNPVNKRI